MEEDTKRQFGYLGIRGTLGFGVWGSGLVANINQKISIEPLTPNLQPQ
jgi:hypothetical protein